ncbi:MAG TPA: hypothetical protein VFU12_09450, partial [Glycomyces sp.]|nr:hypothetical protein [Glycomyces sp.]
MVSDALGGVNGVEKGAAVVTSGVQGLGPATVEELRMHSEKWIIPHLGQAYPPVTVLALGGKAAE